MTVKHLPIQPLWIAHELAARQVELTDLLEREARHPGGRITPVTDFCAANALVAAMSIDHLSSGLFAI